MTTPITPPAPAGPERMGLGERLIDAKDALAIAYHGLLATRIDGRISDTHQDLADAAHDELFYGALRDITSDVVELDYDGRDHVPAPNPHSLANRGLFGPGAESERRMRTGETASLRRGVAPKGPTYFPDEPWTVGIVADLDRPVDPATGEPVRPRTPRQERHDQAVASSIDNIRRARKTNIRNAKVFGSSGQVSERATRQEMVRRQKELDERYKAGEITADERLIMFNMIGGQQIPVETIDPTTGRRVITSGGSFATMGHPRGIHHQEHRSHKASERAFKITRKGRKEARELREDATERLPKLTRRRHARYTKKASSYARRLGYETRDRDPSNPADW